MKEQEPADQPASAPSAQCRSPADSQGLGASRPVGVLPTGTVPSPAFALRRSRKMQSSCRRAAAGPAVPPQPLGPVGPPASVAAAGSGMAATSLRRRRPWWAERHGRPWWSPWAAPPSPPRQAPGNVNLNLHAPFAIEGFSLSRCRTILRSRASRGGEQFVAPLRASAR